MDLKQNRQKGINRKSRRKIQSHPMVGKTVGDDAAVDKDVAAFRRRVARSVEQGFSARIVEKFPARIVQGVAAGSVGQTARRSVVQIGCSVGRRAAGSFFGSVPKVDDE